MNFGAWYLEYIEYSPGLPKRGSIHLITLDGHPIKFGEVEMLAMRKVAELQDRKEEEIKKGYRYEDFQMVFYHDMSENLKLKLS